MPPARTTPQALDLRPRGKRIETLPRILCTRQRALGKRSGGEVAGEWGKVGAAGAKGGQGVWRKIIPGTPHPHSRTPIQASPPAFIWDGHSTVARGGATATQSQQAGNEMGPHEAGPSGINPPEPSCRRRAAASR